MKVRDSACTDSSRQCLGYRVQVELNTGHMPDARKISEDTKRMARYTEGVGHHSRRDFSTFTMIILPCEESFVADDLRYRRHGGWYWEPKLRYGEKIKLCSDQKTLKGFSIPHSPFAIHLSILPYPTLSIREPYLLCTFDEVLKLHHPPRFFSSISS